MVLDILSIFNYLAFSIYLRLISVYYISVKKLISCPLLILLLVSW